MGSAQVSARVSTWGGPFMAKLEECLFCAAERTAWLRFRKSAWCHLRTYDRALTAPYSRPLSFIRTLVLG